jgi:hypothetical protein
MQALTMVAIIYFNLIVMHFHKKIFPQKYLLKILLKHEFSYDKKQNWSRYVLSQDKSNSSIFPREMSN